MTLLSLFMENYKLPSQKDGSDNLSDPLLTFLQRNIYCKRHCEFNRSFQDFPLTLTFFWLECFEDENSSISFFKGNINFASYAKG